MEEVRFTEVYVENVGNNFRLKDFWYVSVIDGHLHLNNLQDLFELPGMEISKRCLRGLHITLLYVK